MIVRGRAVSGVRPGELKIVCVGVRALWCGCVHVCYACMFSICVLLERHNKPSSSLSSSKLVPGIAVPRIRCPIQPYLEKKSLLVARESLNSSEILGTSITGTLGTRLCTCPSRVLSTDKYPNPRPWYFAKVVPKISIIVWCCKWVQMVHLVKSYNMP